MAPGTILPTFAEVSQLPAQLDAAVGAEHIDANGHMNIRHFMEFNARGTWRIVEDIGITDEYRSGRGFGMFTAEHHLKYYSELREGAPLSVHVRVLARGAHSIHLMGFLLDVAGQRLANTLEVIAVHVNLGTRRPAPIPDDIATLLDRQIHASRELDWDPSTCGIMGIRGSTTPTP